MSKNTQPKNTQPNAAIGMRSTKQRSAILELLGQSAAFRSAQQLHSQLRVSGSRIGLTTVYRTLQSLADADLVDVRHTESGELLYRRCSSQRHRHLVCMECATAVEVQCSGIEHWATEVASEHGFTQVEASLEVLGLCACCSSNAGSDASCGDTTIEPA